MISLKDSDDIFEVVGVKKSAYKSHDPDADKWWYHNTNLIVRTIPRPRGEFGMPLAVILKADKDRWEGEYNQPVVGWMRSHGVKMQLTYDGEKPFGNNEVRLAKLERVANPKRYEYVVNRLNDLNSLRETNNAKYKASRSERTNLEMVREEIRNARREIETIKVLHQSWKIVISRGSRVLTSPFHNSTSDTEKGLTPTPYDILSCMQYSDPGEFYDFCEEFDYEYDSRTAESIYHEVKRNALEMQGLFTDKELDELREIAS